MKRITLLLLIILILFAACTKKEKVQRPKLVVGLVIDQMRWDYLYRYYERYGDNGFKRLMRKGYNCQQAMINYIPSNTGPGHACIYTGTVPSVHGISGNDYWDVLANKSVYCASDPLVYQTGDDLKTPSMSPRNMLTTTITDELRLATNLRSRVYGIAIKDRGGIFPAGHLANAAYWYNDRNGTFVSSTYYPNPNPEWLKAFNKRKVADSLEKLNWNLLYPANTYTQSTTDANNYEKGFKGEKAPVFPHITDSLADSDRHSMLKTMPQGNTISLMMAKACIEGEHLGAGDDADFLCVSLSSTDYMGHQFGPNSMEAEDMYLRLDKEIGEFLDYLDSKVGKGNYLFFLTADHGAAHNATFLADNDVPAGFLNPNTLPDLNMYLKAQFGKDHLTDTIGNYQLVLNESLIEKEKLDRNKIKDVTRQWFSKKPEVQYVVDIEDMSKTPVPEPIHTMIVNGYYRLRGGCLQFILNPGWYDYGTKQTGTTHGTWNPYDTHIPLLWYGWHIPKGETIDRVNMTDIAPTIAAMLHIQMPNGCIGKPIQFEKTKEEN